MSGGFPTDTQAHIDAIRSELRSGSGGTDRNEAGVGPRAAAFRALDALLVELAAACTERDRWKEKAGRYMDWYRDETTPLRDARDDAIQTVRHVLSKGHQGKQSERRLRELLARLTEKP